MNLDIISSLSIRNSLYSSLSELNKDLLSCLSIRHSLYSGLIELNKDLISCLSIRHSLYSNPSEPDNSELNTSMTGAGLLGQSWALSLCLQGDEVEEVWRSHVSKVMAEASVQHAIRTCQVFPRLYRVS